LAIDALIQEGAGVGADVFAAVEAFCIKISSE
jgi:hypothetical protein